MKSRHLGLQAIAAFVPLAIMLVAASSSSRSDEATMTIDCTCQTKKNPSWCGTKIGDFFQHQYVVTGFQKPGAPLDTQALATFCHRHADAECLCDADEYFSGAVRQ